VAVQGTRPSRKSRPGSKDGVKEVRWKTEAGVGVEAEDEEREERVVLDGPRPLGLEIGPAEEGRRGAVVRQSEGQAAAAGVERGSMILSINDEDVEDMDFPEIQGMLNREHLPLTLDLRPPLDLLTVKKKKPKRRDPVTVYTAGCRGSYRVVAEAIEHLGWMELKSSADCMNRAPSVVWLEHSDNTDGIAPVQTVSRLEAFLHFCKKARLAESLNAWTEMCPDTFRFSPQTWIIPYDADELKKAMTKCKKDDTFIVKPTAGAQGKGITLARKWKDVETTVQRAKNSQENNNKATIEYVVQRYITYPLLLEGLKFDMRLYVVVTSVVPMRAYLFKEGLARFCTVPYAVPCDENLREAKMHLTNFAVNKKSKDFQPSEGATGNEQGSKRSTTCTFRQMQQAYGISSEETWGKVAVLIANTLMALRPALVEYYVHENPRPLHPLGPKGFQLIGLDVLIDQDLEPRLLELNANPSLSATQPGSSSSSSAAAAAATADASDDAVPDETAGGSSSSAARPRAGGEGLEGTSAGFLGGGAPSPPPSLSLGAQGVTVQPTQMQMLSPSARDIRSLYKVAGPAPRRSRSSVALALHLSSRDEASAGGAAKRPGSAELLTTPSGGRGFGAASLVAAGAAAASVSVGGASSSSGGAGAGGGRQKRGARHLSRSSRSKDPETRRESSKEKEFVTSELDLEIKRELVVQALLLTRPAPQNKVARLKKQWKPRGAGEIIALDDEGKWALSQKATKAETVRPDAPERCPALEPIDFEDLVAPEVWEYAQAHLSLYRWWVRSCGNGRDSLGQAQVQRLLEKSGLIGESGGAVFPDRISCQLWLSRVWRELAPGAFGLNLPQFVLLCGRIGQMLEGTPKPDEDDDDDCAPSSRQSHLKGVLAFTRKGLCQTPS